MHIFQLMIFKMNVVFFFLNILSFQTSKATMQTLDLCLSTVRSYLNRVTQLIQKETLLSKLLIKTRQLDNLRQSSVISQEFKKRSQMSYYRRVSVICSSTSNFTFRVTMEISCIQVRYCQKSVDNIRKVLSLVNFIKMKSNNRSLQLCLHTYFLFNTCTLKHIYLYTFCVELGLVCGE